MATPSNIIDLDKFEGEKKKSLEIPLKELTVSRTFIIVGDG